MRTALENALVPARLIAANPQLRRLAVATTLAELGASAYAVALTIWAFATGGPGLVAVTAAVALVPAALLSPLLAAITDRARREVVIAVSLGARSALLLATAVAMSVGSVVLVLLSAAAASVCVRVFYPAQTALLPDITSSEVELVGANAVMSTIENVGSLLAPVIAGFSLVVVSPAIAVAVCGIVTLAAAAAALTLDQTAPPDASTGETAARTATGGFRAIARDAALRGAVAVYAVHAFAFGALLVAIAKLALDDLALGEAGLGLFEAALAVGGIAGGVTALASASSHRPAAVIRISTAVWGFGLVAAAIVEATPILLVLLGVIGVANVLLDVAVHTRIQQAAAAAAVLARTAASVQSIAVTAVGAGGLFAGGALTLAGTPATLVALGLIVPAAALAVVRGGARELGVAGTIEATRG